METSSSEEAENAKSSMYRELPTFVTHSGCVDLHFSTCCFIVALRMYGELGTPKANHANHNLMIFGFPGSVVSIHTIRRRSLSPSGMESWREAFFKSPMCHDIIFIKVFGM